ncbi:hypothetical protein R3P38DRAFT_1636998 [Favolaschia claudopus]|uniref:Uncharacterized protein n=1 Tax=Favolaschia claudopus TaxID=2862362 RepID=A0AAW0DN99_9AGAR
MTYEVDSDESQALDEHSETSTRPHNPAIILNQPPNQPGAQHLTRQYWDIRRQISTLAVRGEALEQRLRTLHIRDPDIYLSSPALSRRLSRAKQELMEERERSRTVERILQDIRQECRTPAVIPMLLSALEDS